MMPEIIFIDRHGESVKFFCVYIYFFPFNLILGIKKNYTEKKSEFVIIIIIFYFLNTMDKSFGKL